MLLRAAPAAAAALLPATARRASLCGSRRASLCGSMHASTAAPAATEKRVLKGLVFDMGGLRTCLCVPVHSLCVRACVHANPPGGAKPHADGTVIVPCIDFAGMRRACGVLEGQVCTPGSSGKSSGSLKA